MPSWRFSWEMPTRSSTCGRRFSRITCESARRVCAPWRRGWTDTSAAVTRARWGSRNGRCHVDGVDDGCGRGPDYCGPGFGAGASGAIARGRVDDVTQAMGLSDLLPYCGVLLATIVEGEIAYIGAATLVAHGQL